MLPRVLSSAPSPALSRRRAGAAPTPLFAVLALALALALVALCAPLAAGTAHAAGAERHPARQPESRSAAERPVAGGRLDWGIKASFQTYVTGPIAGGSWSLSGGAATVGENQFRFHSANGGYDPDTGALNASYQGGVHFVGHQQDDGSYELDLTISNPSLSISGQTGTLHADMRSKERGTGRVTESSQVPLASVDLTGIDLTGGTQIAVTGAPTSLTAQGATAFAGYYQAGDPLDPLSFTADSQDPAEPEPEDSGNPEDDEESAPEETEEDSGAGETELADAAVDWGVRRTFREYVTGPIAEGSWELSDGAQDGGALFRFPLAEGTADPEAGTAEAEFGGTVRFTGNDLDLTLGAVRVTVADGTGTLLADITRDGEEAASDQPLVTFPAEELAPEDGLVLLSEVPAELTEEGAAAFAGLYPAGTAMDPLTLALAVSEDAELPPLPDLGAEPTAPAEPAADPEPTAEPEADEADDGGDNTPTLIATGAGALLVLAAAAYLFTRRNRRAAPTADPADASANSAEEPATSRNDEETPRS
ncbi:Htaa domain protein [Streptomyces sp. 3MP-14]|uniref:Htaa domain protein n=1 Tax=Streptomyces mimosae TaxID=2586635 RepID=A0A5N6AKV0_9ACTN|nr:MULTISPECIES: HtaA domain-containing protein [Streptomyces]KAB8168520.1 Htaa domain protein [Streptomyces mimosae]KAB8178199.1 Htaa domain protein [Streptomyces sp. 3MP-14]